MTDAANTTTEHEEPSMTTTQVPLPQATQAPDTAGPRRTAQLAAVLRSEWIKASTVRANKVLLAVAAIVGVLTSWAAAAFGAEEGLTNTDVVMVPTLLTAVLAAIAGVLMFTTEVQHGTLAGSLAAHPSRWPVAAAKAVLAAGFGLLLGAVGMAAGALGALAGGAEVGDSSGVVTAVLWGLLYTVGSALLGLGVGMVVRHSAGAVSGVLVWWLVVEGLVVQFAPAEVVRFVPFDTGARTLGIESELDVPEVVAAGLSNPLHASIFWGYVLAALVIGTAMLVRRDPD
jgi:hypothetical protein